MTARIILVRHGETDWNLGYRIQGGASDIPLNAEGKRQAQQLAQRLSCIYIKAIYSSPLKRALETAQTIAHCRNLEVIVEPALREIEVGALEGATKAELGMRFSDYIIQRGVEKKLPGGGEAPLEFQQRCWNFIRSLAEKHSEGDIAAVCHYFVIMSTICTVLGLPLDSITRLRMRTGSLSIISFSDNGARLELFNETSC